MKIFVLMAYLAGCGESIEDGRAVWAFENLADCQVTAVMMGQKDPAMTYTCREGK